MDEDLKNEINASKKERDVLSWKAFALILLGLILQNAFLTIALVMPEMFFILFVCSLIISIFLVFFLLILKFRSASRSSSDIDKIIGTRNDPVIKENSSSKLAEELQEIKDRYLKTNAEFEKTAKMLFEREMELKKANQRLREIESVKSEFVSTAAHQLRTPLTGIKWSYTTLMEKDTGPLNEIQKGIVEKGFETIDYAISVINDLLNTARLEEGKTGFNFSEQPIGPVIHEVLKQHQATIDEKKMKLVVDIPLDSPFKFRFDKERITIVFDNILSNAVKYTKPGGTISLKSFRSEQEIKFKISDEGIGIPEKDLPKVFTKFFRSKKAIGFETSGSGLGLYVAKNIVERHGGAISVESEENKGTTFTITFPIS